MFYAHRCRYLLRPVNRRVIMRGRERDVRRRRRSYYYFFPLFLAPTYRASKIIIIITINTMCVRGEFHPVSPPSAGRFELRFTRARSRRAHVVRHAAAANGSVKVIAGYRRRRRHSRQQSAACCARVHTGRSVSSRTPCTLAFCFATTRTVRHAREHVAFVK